jgi:hypothetical protein
MLASGAVKSQMYCSGLKSLGWELTGAVKSQWAGFWDCKVSEKMIMPSEVAKSQNLAMERPGLEITIFQ